eukprot:3274276-Amphidinium_carterae.1
MAITLHCITLIRRYCRGSARLATLQHNLHAIAGPRKFVMEATDHGGAFHLSKPDALDIHAYSEALQLFWLRTHSFLERMEAAVAINHLCMGATDIQSHPALADSRRERTRSHKWGAAEVANAKHELDQKVRQGPKFGMLWQDIPRSSG